MRHEHLTCALIELRQITQTSARSHGVFPGPPEAFDGMKVVATVGREHRERQLAVVVVECGVELVRPRDPAAIDDHHDLFPGFAEGCPDWVEIWAQLLGITVRHDFREDFGGAILDRAADAEQHPAADAAPRARASPCWAFERLCTAALTLAQWSRGQARALGAAPPTPPGQGKAPHAGFIFVEHNELAPARAVLEGGECEGGIREGRGGRGEPSGRAAVGERIFFTIPRTLSRPSWTPVCWAKTVASARQLHWE
jgi:hypothetical protein